MYTYRYADYLIFNEGKKQHQFFYKWNLDAHTHVYTFFFNLFFDILRTMEELIT